MGWSKSAVASPAGRRYLPFQEWTSCSTGRSRRLRRNYLAGKPLKVAAALLHPRTRQPNRPLQLLKEAFWDERVAAARSRGELLILSSTLFRRGWDEL